MSNDVRSARTTLGQLSDEELDRYAAWEPTGEIVDGDKVLVPARLTADGLVASGVTEVWCRSICTFANGAVHRACAMYRADNSDGPLAWTISNGDEELPLLVPPAPPPVLAMDGPIPFAEAFGLSLDEVFPLEIKASIRFANAPSERSVEVGVLGVLRPE